MRWSGAFLEGGLGGGFLAKFFMFMFFSGPEKSMLGLTFHYPSHENWNEGTFAKTTLLQNPSFVSR